MKKTIYVVPHSHYDTAWLKTYEEYLEVNFSNIYEVLEVLAREEDFRFTLGETALLEPFVERHPQHEATLRRMVKEGRLEVVCGMYVMTDANMPSGESLVRQIAEGKRFSRQTLGVDTKVGWMLDVFGHNPQMPQIMRKSGYDFYVFGRVRPKDSPSEFLWRGLDGSQIICHWMPYHYVIFYPAPRDSQEFAEFVEARLRVMEPHSQRDSQLMLNGADFVPPQGHLPQMVREYNAKQEEIEVVIATPSDFLTPLKGEALPVVEGEFNPVFQGCYSARIEVKQTMKRSEVALLTAESLGAVAQACQPNISDAEEELRPAWKRVLLNQFHDVICGCHSDRVFQEAIRDCQAAGEQAQAYTQRALSFCDSGAKAASGSLQTLWVFNPLAWERREVAEVEVSLVEEGVREVHVEMEDGGEVPCQLADVQFHPDGGLKRFRLAFLASGVPGLGYKRYRLLPGKGEAADASARPQYVPLPHQGNRLFAEKGAARPPLTWSGDVWQGVREATLGNEWFELALDTWSGAITSLRFLDGGWELIDQDNPLGNVIVRQEDRGDLWDYNAPCKGTATSSTFRPMPFPKPWEAEFSSGYAGVGWTEGGPLFAEFRLSAAFGEGSTESRVRVYAHTPRIDFSTSIVNEQKWVRYRVAFPTTLRNGRIVHEVPFGAIERPEGEFPAQNWIDYSDGEKGLALLNQGLPGNNVSDGVLMLSLLKCTTIKGGAADGAFELGKKHEFRYALHPHGGDWRDVGLARKGMEYNYPLVVRASAGESERPDSFSLLKAGPESVVVTSVGNRDGKLTVRLYESHGRRVAAWLEVGKKITSVRETDLLGQPSRRKVFFEGGQIKFHVGPFEIRQFQIETG